jgi:hypothetical protein
MPCFSASLISRITSSFTEPCFKVEFGANEAGRTGFIGAGDGGRVFFGFMGPGRRSIFGFLLGEVGKVLIGRFFGVVGEGAGVE